MFYLRRLKFVKEEVNIGLSFLCNYEVSRSETFISRIHRTPVTYIGVPSTRTVEIMNE